MKKLLLFAVFCFNMSMLFAQSPTLTMSNSAWAIGDNSTQYVIDTTGINAGVSGANVTWNFQNLNLNATQTVNTTFVAPSTTPNYTQFPGATVASSSAGVYQYFSSSATYSNLLGVDGSGLTMFFSDPMKFFSYPFTYNSSSTDNFLSDYLLYGYSFHRTGTIISNGDAWGKLILPGKTINNVLRVKMVQTVSDVATAYTTNSTMTTYWWYDGLSKSPILEITLGQSTNTYQPGVVSYSKRVIISPLAVGIDEAYTDVQNLKIFPNPAKENFTIVCSMNKGKWELTDITGKSVLSGIITEADQNVDCSTMLNGIYLLRTTNEKGQQSVQKLLINR